MTVTGDRSRLWIAALALVVAILVTQGAADRLAPSAGKADAGRLIGRSGFAYLTGVRTFAAAVLWTRLDPINDDFYGSVPLSQKKFLMPSIRLVIALDPNFDEPYYVGPFVLWGAGLKDGALQLAKEGADGNPRSALLQASYAQLLVNTGRFGEARVASERALAAEWKSESDYYNLLAPMEIAFDRSGAKDRADFIRAERVRLAAKFGLKQ